MTEVPTAERRWFGPLAFAVTMAIGGSAIAASRSSTAALGWLAVQPLALVSSAGANLARRNEPRWATVGMLLALAPPLLLGLGMRSSWYRAHEADQLARDERARVSLHRAELKERLQAANGRETELVDGFLDAHEGDRAAVLAALDTPFVSEARLSRLSRSKDLRLIRAITSYPTSPPALLESIWREVPQAWHVSVELARNPRTPAAVLEEVARESNGLLPPALLSHPSLTCTALRNLQSTLARGYLPAADSAVFAAEAARREAQLCAPSSP